MQAQKMQPPARPFLATHLDMDTKSMAQIRYRFDGKNLTYRISLRSGMEWETTNGEIVENRFFPVIGC